MPTSRRVRPGPRGSGSRWATLAGVALALGACSTPGAAHPVAPAVSGAASAARPVPSGSSTGAPARAGTLRVALAGWRLPAPIAREVVLAGPGALLIAGGLTGSLTSAAGVFRLDLATGRLVQVATLPEAVHDAAGAVLGSGGVVFGGGASSTVAAVQGFAIASGAGSRIVGALPQPRSDLVAAVVGGTAYVLGGYDGSATLAAVLATTDGARFRVVAQLPVPVRYAAVSVVDGRILLFGGEANGVATADIQEFDPARGTARVIGALPRPLAHAAAFPLDGQVFLAGGISGGQVSGQVLRVDPVGLAVSVAGALALPVSDAGSATVDGVGYLVGGESGPGTPVTAVQTLRIVG
ncbi:MAG TPA: hypothetical protein VNE21_07210 [Mycobacteriales bacterium]|nr:hypothetical protein [Mycobacteriales bacterium]